MVSASPPGSPQTPEGPAAPASGSPAASPPRQEVWGRHRIDRILAGVLCASGLALLLTGLRPPSVDLRWESGSEREVAGFNLYRQALRVADPHRPGGAASDRRGGPADSDEGEPGRRVNPTPIAAQGSAAQGARYRYRDGDVLRGHRYRYRIEELDPRGQGRILEETITVQVRDQRPWQWGLGLAALAWGLRAWRRAKP